MTELSELQEHKKELLSVIERADMVERLQNNKDFQEIILKGFCTEEMKRCLSLAIAENADASLRELGNQMAKSSMVLERYLATIQNFGNIAKTELPEIDEEIESLTIKGEDK